MSKQDINKIVFKFYNNLPFNVYEDENIAIENIKKFTFKNLYPNYFEKTVIDSESILDVGCGGGWLSNFIAYKYHKSITGIDFNPNAIKFARKINKKLNLKNIFKIENILSYKPNKKFDLIISNGVLHHMKNCLGVLNKLCKFGNKGSVIFVGLYHKYGRKFFLEKFQNSKRNQDDLFSEYKKLHPLRDKQQLKSWFYDQVLHPFETQHVLKEVISVFKENSYDFLGTSINKFEKDSLKNIYKKEKTLYEYGKKKILNNIYYPGFFIVIGKKND